MPDYPLTSDRHPVNQARLIHQTALHVLGEGGTIKTSTWDDLVALTLNVANHSSVERMTQDMERRCMIERPDRGVIRILSRTDVILPIGWVEPDAVPAT